MTSRAVTHPQLPEGIAFFERGWLSSNSVVLWDAEEINCVDTGYVAHAGQTLSLLQHAWPNRQVTRIINTHLHSDHCGGNALLQEVFPGAETLIPIGQYADVVAWNESRLSYQSTGQRCPPFQVTQAIDNSTTLNLAGREWRSVSAPGHDPHAVMLWDSTERILISADALWENGFGIVFPELNGVSAYSDVENTIKIIHDLDPLIVLPGHGALITDVPAAMERARTRLEKFRANPGTHTHHALKALLKFWMLDRKQASWGQLSAWVLEASLMRDALTFGLAQRWQVVEADAVGYWGAKSPEQEWLATALHQLIKAGQLRAEDHIVFDA
jgi:glyoxylase-like metal-dependent hydrolase (beta-lactamase superfamily II)